MEDMADSQKRQIAYKIRIKDLISGEYIKEEGWDPNYIKTLNGINVSRVNLIGTVVAKEREENIFIVIDGINNELIKDIYKLTTTFSKRTDEKIDITLYETDIIKIGIKSNPLLSILFLNIFENSKCLYKTDDFKLLKKKLIDLANKNREFNEKYRRMGRSYAMLKDIMNSIKKSAILNSYNNDI